MDKISLYNNLPVFAQNMACFYEGYRIKRARYSTDFFQYLREYEERSSWSYEQLCEFRDMKLRYMIKHCYNTVPYYTRLFDTLGIDYRSIRTLDDLKVLPILTKQEVKDNFDDFISTAIPRKKMIKMSTGGTTGSGFEFYTTKEAISEQWAVWWRYRRNLGINFSEWCGVFGGKPIVPQKQKRPPFWRINKPGKQVHFSSYHLNNINIPDYLEYINTQSLSWLHGYPSSLSLLASYILENNICLDTQIKFITIGSESLLDHQKSVIEKAFGVKPYEHYGLAESVANISQGLDGALYVDEDFSGVEFINMGGYTHIVGTTLNNFSMPLLRYDTTDIADFEEGDSPISSKRKVKSISGRKDDYIVLINGTKVGRLSTLFHKTINIKEAQIYQAIPGEAVIRIVKNSEYTKLDEIELKSTFKSRLGKDFSLVFEYVDEIERTNGGKLRFVVSEVKY